MALSRRVLTACRDQFTEVRRPYLNGLVATLLIIITLMIWPAVHSSWAAHHDLGISWRTLVFSIMFVGATLLWGLLPTSLVASARSIWDLPLAVVTGSSLLSAGLMLLSFLLPIGPWITLPFLFLCGGLLAYVAVQKNSDFFRPLRQCSPACLLAICIGLLAASGWSQVHLFPFEDAGQALIYKPWTDDFQLARITALFLDGVQPQTLGRPDLSGLGVGFYHYGAYAAAGAFSGITNTPGLTGLDAFAIPWNMFLMAMAAYALGTHWWGPRMGLASLAAACLLPDASFYGFKLGWFGYYWLQQTGASLAWGLALGACSILLVDAACRRAAPRLYLLGLGLGGLTLLFKAQIAAILVPPLLVWGVLFFPGIKKLDRVQLLVYIGIILAVLVLVATRLAKAPSIALSGEWGASYLRSILNGVNGEEAQRLWQQASASKWLLPQVALMLISSFGVLPLIWLVAILIRRARKQATVSDLLPLLFVLIHLAVIFGLEGNTRGNRWELHHRPFVLIYFLLAVWCGGAVLTLLLDAGRAFSRHRRKIPAPQQHPEEALDTLDGTLARPRVMWPRLVTVAGLLSLLAFPLLLGNQIVGEQLWFAKSLAYTALPKDYLTCTDHIRRHAARTDIVQASDNDPMGITGALTERTAYLARPDLQVRKAAYSSVAAAHAAALTALATAETVQAFENLVARLPIRWYLLKPDTEVSWPASIASKPTFQCGAYRVYDLDVWQR